MAKGSEYRHISIEDIVLDEKELYRIKGFNPSKDFQLYEVSGERMCPTLLPMEIIISQEISRIDNLKKNGHLVLLSLNGKLQAKRIAFNSDPDSVLLLNDNPEDSEIKMIKKSEMGKVLVIRGKICNSLIPDVEHISRGKIRELNETLQTLKKEIYLANNRLRYLRNKN